MSDNIKEIKSGMKIGERKFSEPLKADALVRNISLKTDSSSFKSKPDVSSAPSKVEEREESPSPERMTVPKERPAASSERITPSNAPVTITDARKAVISRKTKETDISCTLTLDGKGDSNIKTGIGFFDHMLDGFARHGLFDLTLTCDGDLYVDCHHTIEDCGIVLGQALREAIGDKRGMIRYGSFTLPMDEALVLCAVDFSGRPYLGFDYEFKAERVGYFDTDMVREFFYAVSYSAMMNLHFDIMRGTNAHHVIEAMFKAFAKATDVATTVDPRITDILSTKGML